jgi:hypothetical protein
MRKEWTIILAWACSCPYIINAQVPEELPPVISTVQQEPPKKPTVPELRYNFSEDGKLYWKLTFLNQTWVRFNESNAGTTVEGDKARQTVDIGLRRTRIQMFGQVTPNTFLYFQFGQNNFNFLAQNAGNRKLQPFFHDALAELTPLKSKTALRLGAGITITNGISRFRQPSVGTIMTMDVPVFAQATVDQIDEFSRMLSIYARGQFHKLDYRLGMADPFPIQTNGATQPNILSKNSKTYLFNTAYFSQLKHHKQYFGYVAFNFFDAEAATVPGYMTGTYLGTKKIFNIGGGIAYQRDATYSRASVEDSLQFHNLKLWAVESFLDMPLHKEKGTAISAYAGYFNLNYGNNYLRFNGVMNPASGIAGLGTLGTSTGYGTNAGNAYPMFGTGQVVYAQAGYLFPREMLGTFGTLMPYATAQAARFDAVKNSVNTFGAGVNWLLDGHRSKITLDYQNRGDFQGNPASGDKVRQNGRRSQVTLQYQVFI